MTTTIIRNQPRTTLYGTLNWPISARKEIGIAEKEMPGLMATREKYGPEKAARRRKDHGLAAHDHPDRRSHRDAR